MVAFSQPHLYTPEEYLALERKAEFRSEYLQGRILAMSGGTPQHGAIAVNIASELRFALKKKPCQVFSSDVKIRTAPSGLFSYPDVSVVCGELQFHDATQDVLTNPIALVEVLSPSTEAFDRGKKFLQYRHLDSLRDYLLVAQDSPVIEHYTRQDNGWLLTSVVGLTSEVYIPSLDCTLSMAEVYDKIEFPPEPDLI